MSKVFVDVGMSLDGYIAGPNRGPKNPLGDGGVDLHQIEAGLVEEITLHIAPALLGSGVRLFEPLGPGPLRLEQAQVSHSPLVTHVTYKVLE